MGFWVLIHTQVQNTQVLIKFEPELPVFVSYGSFYDLNLTSGCVRKRGSISCLKGATEDLRFARASKPAISKTRTG